MPRLPPSLEPIRASLSSIDEIPDSDASHMLSAGVLVLLFPRGSDVRFLLTARPETLSRHAGQISLPGGRMEGHDASLWDTAVRETEEELGIRTGRLVPLGRLDPTPVAVSNYLVWPFVAWNPVAPRLKPDPNEVAAVVEVSLSSLLDWRSVQREEWELRGARWHVTLYRFGDVAVWGATARILSDLASRVDPAFDGASYRPGDVEMLVEPKVRDTSQ